LVYETQDYDAWEWSAAGRQQLTEIQVKCDDCPPFPRGLFHDPDIGETVKRFIAKVNGIISLRPD
jgi:hypothetical protein